MENRINQENEMVKLFTNGEVLTKDGRNFTRLIGGFGNDKPMFTLWQAAELLGQETKAIRQNFESNESNFQENVDFMDLKVASISNAGEINVDIKGFLKNIGYSQNKLNATKRWLAFSFSGMMKLVKISESEESWNIYDSFLEDYFKTKAENKVKDKILKEELEELEDERFKLLGVASYNPNEEERVIAQKKAENLNDRIAKIKSAIDNKLIAEALRNQIKLSQSKQEYISQAEFGDRFNNKIGSKTIGKLLKVCNLAKKSKVGRTIPYQTVVPEYANNNLHDDKVRDYDVSYVWNYNKCVIVIDKWLKEHRLYEKFYSITDKDILEAYIHSLYIKYVLDNEEEEDY